MSISEKLVTIAENQKRVFDAGRNSGGGGGDYDSGYSDGYDNGYYDGYNDGYDSGYDSGYYEGQDIGYSEGQQSEYDRFWDAFQDSGNLRDYQYGFTGARWNNETFKPKYDLVLGGGYSGAQMFFNCQVTNIAEALENQGVRLDTKKAETLGQMFQYSSTVRIPELDCTKCWNHGLEYAFYNAPANTIDKLIVHEGLQYTGTFGGCDVINITFDGVIGESLSFDASWRLSKASMQNIFEHLSATASGKTLTILREAVERAFGSTTASAWTSLVNSRSNWTISLV